MAEEDGSQYVGITKNGILVSDPFDGEVETCSITIDNPTSQNAIFRFYYSPDGGSKWITLNSIGGSANPSVSKGTTETLNFTIPSQTGALYRIMQFSGSTTSQCKIRNVCFGLRAGSLSGIESVLPDYDEAQPVEWYNLQGVRISDPSGMHGIFIVKQGSRTCKISR